MIFRSARRAGCIAIALDMTYRTTYGEFPTVSAILFGLGLGTFFHGVVFRQALQWRHRVGTGYPVGSLESMRLKVAS